MRFLLALVLFLPLFANAAACTPGTDCYCDKVEDSGHADYDANLLFCEDFEAPSMRDYTTTRDGDSGPYYGNFVDDDDGFGETCNRGGKSYWYQEYGTAGSALWESGEPGGTPNLGCNCSYTGGADCFGIKAWSLNDEYDANGYTDTFLGILATDEFDDFISGQVNPSRAAGGGSGAFDGTASLGYKINTTSLPEIAGTKSLSSDVTELGITIAYAFPDNIVDSGIVGNGSTWKFDELGTDESGSGDGIFGFGSSGNTAQFPFYGFMFFETGGGETQSSCNTKLSAATVTLGNFQCSSSDLNWTASSSQYVQSTDWPFNSWGCVRVHLQGLGTSSMSMETWVTAGGNAEKKVLDISGMDTSLFSVSVGTDGYDTYVFNPYPNANQGAPDVPVSETTGRYQDNIHLTNGAPVSCEQIGFGDTASTPETNPSIYMLSLLATVFTPLLDTLKDAIDTSFEDQPGRIWAAFCTLFAALIFGLMVWRNRA